MMPDTAEALRHGLPTYPLDRVPPALTGGAVAIGNFDGVHRGHAALIQAAVAAAKSDGAPAVLLTFDPHPRTFFKPDRPVFQLTSSAARARLMAALGLDAVVEARFDDSFSNLEPEAFEETVLADSLSSRWVVVGEGFRFGKGRAGTTERLILGGERLGYDVIVIEPVVTETEERVSSSAIREALSAGDVAAANLLLGYRWFVVGTVIHGEKRGRELGFPTANIQLPGDCKLRHGIYAATLTRRGGAALPAVASYGRRPQFDDGPPLLEVFVFDFEGDLYGEEVIVTLYDWIRPERRFPSIDALVQTMSDDCFRAREVLSVADTGTPLDKALAAVQA